MEEQSPLLKGIPMKDSLPQKIDTTQDIIPILDQYPQISTEELTRLAYNTGKGFFLTFGISRDAFKHRWIPKQALGKSEELSPRQILLFDATLKKYNVKNIVADAIGKARAYGQSVICLVHDDPNDPNSDVHLRSLKYERMNLIFDPKTNLLVKMRLPIIWGHYMNITEVPIENCVLFINGIHPFGFPYLGRSELDSCYYYIRSAMNIMDNWTKLFSQRGLGLIDITINNANQKTIELAKEYYSDPTQYSAVIHDNNIEVKTINGISSGYSIKETNEMFMKEVSSGSGVSYTKLDGGNTYVSGVIADQDNYAANFQLLHQQWHNSIVKVIELCEPRLKGKISVDFEIEIKLDKTQTIQIQSTFLTLVLSCPEIFSLNDLLRGLDMEIVKGGDSITVAEYLFEMRKEIYGPMVSGEGTSSKEQEGNIDPVEAYTTKKDLFHERAGKNDNKIKGNVALNLKNARRELTNKKKNLAKSIIQQIKTTPYAPIVSDSEIIDTIKNIFGSGISKATLSQIKSERPIIVSDDYSFKEIIEKVAINNPNLSEQEIVDVSFGIYKLIKKKKGENIKNEK